MFCAKDTRRTHDSRKQFALEMLFHIEEDGVYFDGNISYVWEFVDTVVMYGEVKILMMLLDTSVLHRRSLCGAL